MKSPLTNTTNTSLIKELSPIAIANDWVSSMGIHLDNEFKALAKIEYWRCNETGLYWYSPAEAAGGNKLYEQLEKFDWYYMADKWEFEQALLSIGSKKKVFEVGVGSGHFLNMAKSRGHEVSGIELNPSAAARVRELGLLVFDVGLEELGHTFQENFDAVCTFQVLEHVSEPMLFLKGMLNLLKPGGLLVISVPNAAVSRVIDPEQVGLLDQPPHHMTKWDASVFRQLEALLPLNLVRVKQEPLQPYHIDWFVGAIASRLRKLSGNPLVRLFVNRYSIFLAKRLLLLGFRKLVPGHTMMVIFKKK